MGTGQTTSPSLWHRIKQKQWFCDRHSTSACKQLLYRFSSNHRTCSTRHEPTNSHSAGPSSTTQCADKTNKRPGTDNYNTVSSNRSSCLHSVAAIVLMIFAISHFAALAFKGPQYMRLNAVIPLLTDAQLFLVAGFMELVIGVLSLRWRGDTKASVMILLFVGLMGWYRFSLEWLSTGGRRCGCFGLMGLLLGMSVETEKLFSAGVLVVLVMCAVPALRELFITTKAVK